MIATRGDLSPSKSFAVREWTLVQLPGMERPVLTITQSRRERGTLTYAHRYEVEEDATEPFPMRAFILRKQTAGDGGDETFYRVVLLCEAGQCGCDGYTAGKRQCKHIVACLAILRAGGFDDGFGAEDEPDMAAAFDGDPAGCQHSGMNSGMLADPTLVDVELADLEDYEGGVFEAFERAGLGGCR